MITLGISATLVKTYYFGNFLANYQITKKNK